MDLYLSHRTRHPPCFTRTRQAPCRPHHPPTCALQAQRTCPSNSLSAHRPLAPPACALHNAREISDYYRATTGSGELTPSLRLLAGACAGIIAMSATYPLDMVRGRLTVQEGKNQQYRGIVHAARSIIAQVGLRSVARRGA